MRGWVNLTAVYNLLVLKWNFNLSKTSLVEACHIICQIIFTEFSCLRVTKTSLERYAWLFSELISTGSYQVKLTFKGKETKPDVSNANTNANVEPPYASVDKTPELKPKLALFTAPTVDASLTSPTATSASAPPVDRSVKPATSPSKTEKEKSKKKTDHQVGQRCLKIGITKVLCEEPLEPILVGLLNNSKNFLEDIPGREASLESFDFDLFSFDSTAP